jgi:hypothetical protein
LDIKIIGSLPWRISGHIRLVFNIRSFKEVFIAGIHAEIRPGIPPNTDFHILPQDIPCRAGWILHAGIDPRIPGLG